MHLATALIVRQLTDTLLMKHLEKDKHMSGIRFDDWLKRQLVLQPEFVMCGVAA
jgi:hypothetical protein